MDKELKELIKLVKKAERQIILNAVLRYLLEQERLNPEITYDELEKIVKSLPE